MDTQTLDFRKRPRYQLGFLDIQIPAKGEIMLIKNREAFFKWAQKKRYVLGFMKGSGYSIEDTITTLNGMRTDLWYWENYDRGVIDGKRYVLQHRLLISSN